MRDRGPIALLLLVAAAASLVTCAPAATAELVDLSESLEPFTNHFDEASGFTRFVAVLSPT